MPIPDSQWYSLELCLKISMYKISMFLFLKISVFYPCFLQKPLVHFYCGKTCKEYQNETLLILEKTTILSTLFQEHHCESNIPTFARKVTWNYAYSPFKDNYHFWHATLPMGGPLKVLWQSRFFGGFQQILSRYSSIKIFNKLTDPLSRRKLNYM